MKRRDEVERVYAAVEERGRVVFVSLGVSGNFGVGEAAEDQLRGRIDGRELFFLTALTGPLRIRRPRFVDQPRFYISLDGWAAVEPSNNLVDRRALTAS